MNDVNAINMALKAIGIGSQASPGTLKVINQQTAQTAEAVNTVIRDFGGEGWVLSARHPEVIRLLAGQAGLPENCWVSAAEVCNGSSSLHVSRMGEEWELLTIEETTGEGMLMPAQLKARTVGGFLNYAVSYTEQDVNGNQELRPAMFRFRGFEPMGGGK